MNGRDEPSYRSALAAFDEACVSIRATRAPRTCAQCTDAHRKCRHGERPASLRETEAQALDAANRAVVLAPAGAQPCGAGSGPDDAARFCGREREQSQARTLAPNDVAWTALTPIWNPAWIIPRPRKQRPRAWSRAIHRGLWLLGAGVGVYLTAAFETL